MARIRIKACWLVFGVMVVFIIVALSPLRDVLHVRGDFRRYVLPLGVLGVLLTTLAVVTQMGRTLKTFMVMAGASALGWLASLYLHSLLFRFFPTEPVTYILVFYVLPITFIVGIVGAIVTGARQAFFQGRQ